MAHFLRVVGSSLDGYIKKRLSALDTWREGYRTVSRQLRDAMNLVDTWTSACAQLTGVFWVGVWKSGPFRDDVLLWLHGRLAEVLGVRSVHHQLTSLLTNTELIDLKVDAVRTRAIERPPLPPGSLPPASSRPPSRPPVRRSPRRSSTVSPRRPS